MKNKLIQLLAMQILICCSSSFFSCQKKDSYTITYKSYISYLNDIPKKINEATSGLMSLSTENGEEKYYEGLTKFRLDGKYGFKDTTGNIIIEPQFDGVGCFNEGYVSVTMNGCPFEYVTSDGDTATGIYGGKMGFIDKTGKLICEPKYDFCNFFVNGLAPVSRDGKEGYIDYSGKEVIAVQYDNPYPLNEFYNPKQLVAVLKNGKWGYIDITGREVVALQYDEAKYFDDPDGFAAVKKDGKWGLIDRKGRIVVPIIHNNASSTLKGKATVFPNDNNVLFFEIYNNGNIDVICKDTNTNYIPEVYHYN